MVVGDKKFGVVSYVIVGVWGEIFVFCASLGLHFVRFVKQIFRYTALHYMFM
jgi:hypothetical protein